MRRSPAYAAAVRLIAAHRRVSASAHWPRHPRTCDACYAAEHGLARYLPELAAGGLSTYDADAAVRAAVAIAEWHPDRSGDVDVIRAATRVPPPEPVGSGLPVAVWHGLSAYSRATDATDLVARARTVVAGAHIAVADRALGPIGLRLLASVDRLYGADVWSRVGPDGARTTDADPEWIDPGPDEWDRACLEAAADGSAYCEAFGRCVRPLAVWVRRRGVPDGFLDAARAIAAELGIQQIVIGSERTVPPAADDWHPPARIPSIAAVRAIAEWR